MPQPGTRQAAAWSQRRGRFAGAARLLGEECGIRAGGLDGVPGSLQSPGQPPARPRARVGAAAEAAPGGPCTPGPASVPQTGFSLEQGPRDQSGGCWEASPPLRGEQGRKTPPPDRGLPPPQSQHKGAGLCDRGLGGSVCGAGGSPAGCSVPAQTQLQEGHVSPRPSLCVWAPRDSGRGCARWGRGCARYGGAEQGPVLCHPRCLQRPPSGQSRGGRR